MDEKTRLREKKMEFYKNCGSSKEEVRAELKKINSKMSLFAENKNH